MTLNTEELNEIIQKVNDLKRDNIGLPYCKGTVYANDVITLLKEYWDRKTTKDVPVVVWGKTLEPGTKEYELYMSGNY